MNTVTKIALSLTFILGTLTIYATKNSAPTRASTKDTSTNAQQASESILDLCEHTAEECIRSIKDHKIISGVIGGIIVFICRKPILNFFKTHISSWLCGDTIARINTRTETIERDLAALRQTTERLHEQIAALPAEHRQALAEQEATLLTRIAELENTVQRITQEASAEVQREIGSLRDQIVQLSESLTRAIAASEQRFERIADAIASGAQAVRDLDQHIMRHLERILSANSIRSTSFPIYWPMGRAAINPIFDTRTIESVPPSPQ